MLKSVKSFLLLTFIFLNAVSPLCHAAAQAWKIIPNESILGFTAIQNGAPAQGTFKNFNGEINFDPAHLTESHIKIIVDMASVSDTYNKLTETLKTPDWFNIQVFPQAVFQSKEINKLGDKNFAAIGTLTIRGKTVPVTLLFSQEESQPTKVVMQGNTVINRLDFGIGQGEWADTDTIKNQVHVYFKVAGEKK